MTRFIIHRLLGLVPTMFIIVSLSFFIVRIAPGGPFDAEKALPEQVLANIEKKYHMDEPLLMQYGRYLFDVVRGDLGLSLRYQDKPVSFYIFKSLPVSIFLGLITIAISLILGVGAGLLSALRQNSYVDYFLMGCAVIGLSIPAFVVGPLLMYFLATQWHLLPTSGWITGRYGAVTLIMPVATLVLPRFATFARSMRCSVLEVMRKDYVRTAAAKGLGPSAIVMKHILKGSLLPIVTLLGPSLARVLTGTVVVEQIFRIPGLGKFFVQSAFNRDYTMTMGTVIVYSAFLIVLNLIVDIAYSFLDPRISYK